VVDTVHVVQEHTLPRPKGLVECGVVLDIGAGIRPMNWYQPKFQHICIEPYIPYCEVLEEKGGDKYQVCCLTAEEALRPDNFEGVDAIYLLDVIEHMEKEEALRVLDLARAAAQVQVVVYTPYGFVEQTKDVWGMGGDAWQTHRSGWLPEDFHKRQEGWRTELYHDLKPGERSPEGFYALWEPSKVATSIPN